MNPSLSQFIDQLSRRSFLKHSASGIGTIALASMMANEARADIATGKGVYKPKNQKIKRVIHLCMAGGPSHLETFDYKPELAKLHKKPMPESYTKGQPIAQLQGKKLTCFGPQWAFKRHGKSGLMVSEPFPHIGSIADDICIIKSMHTDQINHDPAHRVFNSGTSLPGRPSMGSWINYGLGSDCEDLPGFVVLVSVGGGQSQPIAQRQWSSGFLPSKFQGVKFNAKGDPVYYVGNPKGVNQSQQGDLVNIIKEMNKISGEKYKDPEVETRIAQYEMAFKMQKSVPELMDMSKEPKEVLEKYGCTPGDGSFGANCLLARKLAERGVRFIQLYHRGWDHHGGVKNAIKNVSKLTDKPTAALINDLKERGMLDETLIIWGGEFGRTPMAQGSGRDHHIKGYSMFLCGGGIKGGMTYGNTDELGYNAVENKVHVRDLHATILHLLGIDHNKFKFKFQGLDASLTGVDPAKVLKDILV